VELTVEHKPDVVLMDISMPNMNGIEAKQIVDRDEDVQIVVLTSFADRPQIIAADRRHGPHTGRPVGKRATAGRG
jgi:DNA-binding NarL/FixJ family response regulator